MNVRHSPVRVLHLRDSPWIDGPGRTILETASHIDRGRVEYHVAVFVASRGVAHPLIEEMNRRGLSAHEVVDDGSSIRPVIQSVLALVDALRIEILHTSEFRSNVVGVICRFRRPLRLVATAHGWIANDLRGKLKCLLDRVLLSSFDRVIVVSNATGHRLPRWLVPDERRRILHNALACRRFEGVRLVAQDRANDGDRDIRLLNVGRLSAEKGQALLLHAVAELLPAHPHLRLSFAGTGPLEPQLRELAGKLGITGKVHFLGYQSDMQAVYAGADLVVQSSLTEGLPNVVLEAAFLGVPIVATAVGGTPEVIEHDVSGWLVRPNSKAELVAGIRRFLLDPTRFASMTRAARASVVSGFSFEARTDAQTELYLDLGRFDT